MAASCVSRGSAALHRLLNILRPYGALPEGNMFDFEDISLFCFEGAKVRKKVGFQGEKTFFLPKGLWDGEYNKRTPQRRKSVCNVG